MNIDIGINSYPGEDLKLRRAMLIYEYDQEYFVTVNNVVKGKIHRGTPVNNSLLDEFIQGLRAGNKQAVSMEFIPDNIIAASPIALIWHVPEHQAKIWFKTDTKIKAVNGKKVVWPHVLFMAKGRNLSVFALRRKRRPKLTTKLYLPPFWNVASSGRICLPSVSGSGKLPGMGIADIPKWEALFFESSFSHPGSSVKNITKYPGGHSSLWQDNVSQEWKQFPSKMLVPMKYTLNDLIKGEEINHV